MNREAVRICGIRVDHPTIDELLDAFVELSGDRESNDFATYLNAHIHNQARHDTNLRECLEAATICYVDGFSIVLAARFLGFEIARRTTGGDWVDEMMRRFGQAKRRVFFLGDEPGIAQQAATKLRSEIPDLEIVGTHHGFFDEEQEESITAMIREARPDVMLVGMGTPRQEKWIVHNRDALGIPLIWAIGNMFKLMGGLEKRCPHWMGESGLEWLYRLCFNPRKLARRYLVGNPSFVNAVLRERISKGSVAARSERRPSV